MPRNSMVAGQRKTKQGARWDQMSGSSIVQNATLDIEVEITQIAGSEAAGHYSSVSFPNSGSQEVLLV